VRQSPAAPGSAQVATPAITPTATSPGVPEAAPVSLAIPAIGLRAAVTEYPDAMVAAHGGAVNPESLTDVSWWSGGGTPGADSRHTVYLYGHTWREPAVFNDLKQLTPGAEVLLTTSTGVLRYVVDRCFTVPKPSFPFHVEVTRDAPGRLLLVGCYRETGLELATTQNVVVTAHLAP